MSVKSAYATNHVIKPKRQIHFNIGTDIKNGKEMKMGKNAKENYMNGGKRP